MISAVSDEKLVRTWWYGEHGTFDGPSNGLALFDSIAKSAREVFERKRKPETQGDLQIETLRPFSLVCTMTGGASVTWYWKKPFAEQPVVVFSLSDSGPKNTVLYCQATLHGVTFICAPNENGGYSGCINAIVFP